MRALGIGLEDEVIIARFTCTAVTAPVLYCGAIRVYADIDPRMYNMDPSYVERLIGPRTRTLVIQHTFGIPADIPKLLEFCEGMGRAYH